MTIEAIMATLLTMTALIGVLFMMLYFKIDNIEDDVNEIKRKMEDKKNDKRRSGTKYLRFDTFSGG